jgi:hypothetical protein
MVHQHYEAWLLNDERLTPEQERDLRIHLRSCPDCAALARANLALRAAPVVASPKGFALRFQERLAAQRQVQRRRAIFGVFLLTLAGLGLLGWALLPFLPYLALEPEQVFALWVSNLVYIAMVIRTVSAIGLTLLNVAGAFIPDTAWIAALTLVFGLSFVLKKTARRVGQFAKSAA